MKQKFIIKKTGEELHIGDKICLTSIKKTSFGKISSKEILAADEELIESLVNKGLVEVVKSRDIEDLSFYISILAQKMNIDYDEVVYMLNKLNKVNRRAVLDTLLKVIAEAFYNEDPKAFDEAEHYYSLRPSDGKCGEVHKVHSYIPLFKSKEDVEAARKLLKEQLISMYGEC